MTITIIAAALVLWIVIGGIVAIAVCPLIKSRASAHQPSEQKSTGHVDMGHASNRITSRL
jgi:hypothetical protein